MLSPFACSRRTLLSGLLGSMIGPFGMRRIVAAEFPFKDDPARFAKSIDQFTHDDQRQPPTAGGVLFVGSSSIRLWNQAAAFPGLPCINRGFGGSHLSDLVHYADRVIWPYQPRVIVVYAGDNDLKAGKSAARVADDYGALVKRIRQRLSTAQIVYLTIKPSPSRWSLVEQQHEANRRIQSLVAQDPRSTFVDLGPTLLDPQGLPHEGYFLRDRLHLNFLGYHQWNEALRPVLARLVHLS